jgi:hypothetical protein
VFAASQVERSLRTESESPHRYSASRAARASVNPHNVSAS